MFLWERGVGLLERAFGWAKDGDKGHSDSRGTWKVVWERRMDGTELARGAACSRVVLTVKRG